jgi:transposase
VCVRTRGRRRNETRTFGTVTRSLDAGLAAGRGGDDRGDGVDLDLLEGPFLLPGRGHGRVAAQRAAYEGGPGPQDVPDAEWIAQELQRGLLRPSFVPPPAIRRLRMLTRYRDQLLGTGPGRRPGWS